MSTPVNQRDGEWLTDQTVDRLRLLLPGVLPTVDPDLAAAFDPANVHPGVLPVTTVYPSCEVAVPDVDEGTLDLAYRHADGSAVVYVISHVQHHDREVMYRLAWRMNRAVRLCLAAAGAFGEGTIPLRFRSGITMSPDPRNVDHVQTAGMLVAEVGWTGAVAPS